MLFFWYQFCLAKFCIFKRCKLLFIVFLIKAIDINICIWSLEFHSCTVLKKLWRCECNGLPITSRTAGHIWKTNTGLSRMLSLIRICHHCRRHSQTAFPWRASWKWRYGTKGIWRCLKNWPVTVWRAWSHEKWSGESCAYSRVWHLHQKIKSLLTVIKNWNDGAP